MGPVKPMRSRLSMTMRPGDGRSEAPSTATERGRRRGARSIERGGDERSGSVSIGHGVVIGRAARRADPGRQARLAPPPRQSAAGTQKPRGQYRPPGPGALSTAIAVVRGLLLDILHEENGPA